MKNGVNGSEHKPVLIVIAGPNGSGKTSVTTHLLHHEWMEDAIYINPDMIAQERFGDCANAAQYADKTYLYDNSIDNHEVIPLCRMNFGKMAKQYTVDLPEWANLILEE